MCSHCGENSDSIAHQSFQAWLSGYGLVDASAQPPFALAEPTVVRDYTALLDPASWNGSGVTGTPKIVTYSFETAAAGYLSSQWSSAFLASFKPFTDSDKVSTRQAVQMWDDASGLVFIEVPAGLGDIKFSHFDFALDGRSANSNGLGYFPSVSIGTGASFEHEIGGDIFIDDDRQAALPLMLHEIGHGIGLKHPFDGSPVLASDLDNFSQTVMSYTGTAPSALGPLDLDAVQYKYGPNAATNLSAYGWNASTLQLTQVGTAAADTIIGVGANDIIMGDQGNDLLAGLLGDDYLSGGSGSDRLLGGRGNDRLLGGGDADRLYGEDGDDELIGGAGADELWGGAGFNYASYSDAAAAVTVNRSDPSLNSGDAAGDLLFNIQGILGSIYGDVIVGAGADETLAGFAGADTIAGLGGNDTLVGGAGEDWLNGNDGFDIASYAGSANAVSVSLLNGIGWSGDAAGDTLGGIESLLGSQHGDYLIGDGDHNIIEGGAGSDYIDGLGGNDWISFEHAAAGVALNMALTADSGYVGEAAGDSVVNVENIRGSAYDDFLYGDSGANILRGDGGGDVLYGAANSDTIYYSTSAQAVNVDLSSNTAWGGDAHGDTLVSVENVFATAYNDILVGDSASNTLVGWYGIDALTGGGGNDIFRWGDTNESGLVFGGRDVVVDFYRVHGDLLDFSGVDAVSGGGDDAFAFIGYGAFSGAGQLRYTFDGAGNTVIEINTNADIGADMSIQLSTQLDMIASDFML